MKKKKLHGQLSVYNRTTHPRTPSNILHWKPFVSQRNVKTSWQTVLHLHVFTSFNLCAKVKGKGEVVPVL